MDPTPLVSVVLPCYNGADFIADAIDSVRAQTYPAVELIVVDDGSTDASGEIAAAHHEVTLLRQPRGGLSAARNAGWRTARGDLIVFLDADDRLLPTALAVGAAALKEHSHCAFVYGRYRLIGRDGKPMPPVAARTVTEQHYIAMLRSNYIGMHAAVMYRRSILEELGGFRVALPRCEDYDMYLRVLRRYPAFGHTTTVAEYRQHGGNMSRDDAAMLKSALAVLRFQRDFIVSDEERAACRDGALGWQDYYGRRLSRALARHVSGREWMAAVRDAWCLLWYAPSTLASTATGIARARVARSISTRTSR